MRLRGSTSGSVAPPCPAGKREALIVPPLPGGYSQFACHRHILDSSPLDPLMLFPTRIQSFFITSLAPVVASVLALTVAIAEAGEPPSLLVVVSVDQLAYDYLERF